MAGDWIPFDHDLPDKEEVLAIAARTGASVADTVLRLCRLWCWFDRHTIDGKMRRISSAGVALKCGGDETFWQAVCDIGWLKIVGDDVSIPGFSDRFGSSARRRLLEAKRKTLYRLEHTSKSTGGRTADDKAHDVRSQMRPQCAPSAPQEPLSHKKEEKKKGVAAQHLVEQGSTAKELPPTGKPHTPTADIDTVVSHYRKRHPHSRPGAKERGKIAARLKEGYSAIDLCEAIDGCHKTPYNCGDNERGTKYLGLELIVRDSDHVARFIENNRQPPQLPDGPPLHFDN